MEDPARARRRAALFALSLLLTVGIVFRDVLSAGFVRWDDGLHVYANPFLHPLTWHSFGRLWAAPYQNLYVPLSYTLYAALALTARLPAPVLTPDGFWTDLSPLPFHAASLALHGLNAVLVFLLLRRLLPPRAPAVGDWAAWAGALLFAVHPVQAESVAWVSELRGLLSAAFCLFALHAWLGALEKGSAKKPLGRYALATACFALALLAKPSAATLPLTAWALAALVLRRPRSEWGWGLAGWGALSFAALWLTHGAQPVTEDIVPPLWFRPVVAGDALLICLGHVLWPAYLGIDYGRGPLVLRAGGSGCFTAPAALALGAGAVWVRRRLPWVTGAACLFAAALLPTLGLTPFAFQVYSTVADRYLYFALLGPALGLAWGLTALYALPAPRLRLAVTAACACLLLACGLQASLQTLSWHNSLALFSQALAVNPKSWGACNNLGALFLDRGEPQNALGPLAEAVRLRPAYAEAHANLGVALLRLGAAPAAETEFRTALADRPALAAARAGLALTLTARRR